MKMAVLSDEDRLNIHKYQYRGGDTSPIYVYILSPLAQHVANNMPTWMAPNLITFIGLLFSVLSCVFTLIYNPSLSTDCPRWLSLVTAICVLIYQTLDNVDGKQARRTGSSSPLGSLFDHGCDAINAGILSIPIASSAGTGWTIGIFFCYWCSFVPFYFQTWEEYYLGEMFLPIFNGPTEGLLIVSVCCITSFFNGSAWWHEPIKHESIFGFMLPSLNYLTQSDIHTTSLISWDANKSSYLYFPSLKMISPGEVTPFRLINFFFLFAVLGTVTKNITKVLCNIYLSDRKKIENKLLQNRKRSIFKALFDLLPFLILFPSAFLWLLNSKLAFSKYPILSNTFISCVFVEMTTHVMLRHVCSGNIRVLGRYLVFPIFLLAWNVTKISFDSNFSAASIVAWDFSMAIQKGPISSVFSILPIKGSILIDSNSNPSFDEEKLLVVSSLVGIIALVWTLCSICLECSEALGIFVFRLGKRTSSSKSK